MEIWPGETSEINRFKNNSLSKGPFEVVVGGDQPSQICGYDVILTVSQG